MSVSGPWIASFCAVVMVGLAGCGGGSNNTSSGPGGGGGGISDSTTVTYSFTGATPTVVATKIGTGAFTQASLQSGKLTLSIPTGTTNYSVAWVCPTITTSYSVPANGENVAQASTLDGSSFTENCFNSTVPPQGSATLSVNAAAIPGAGEVSISQCCGMKTADWSAATSISGVMPSGTYDVFVVVNDDGGYPLAVKVLRSQTIPGVLNGGNTLVFGASDQTVQQTLTYKNVGAGLAVNYVDFDYNTAGGLAFSSNEIFPPTTSFYPAMPLGMVQSGDYSDIFFVEGYGQHSLGSVVGLRTATGGAQTITFPSLSCSCDVQSAAAFPIFNMNYTGFAGMPSVSLIASIEWGVGVTPTHPYSTSSASIEVISTDNYQHGATTLNIPDLTGLTGFLASAPSGTSVIWNETVQQGSFTTSSGSTQSVWYTGTYTEP